MTTFILILQDLFTPLLLGKKDKVYRQQDHPLSLFFHLQFQKDCFAIRTRELILKEISCRFQRKQV